jgi:hypothetical protein
LTVYTADQTVQQIARSSLQKPPMSVRYHCPHLAGPAPPLSPSYASSSSSFNPLGELYFCEECDAVRCDLCCVSEIASYFCPNCTFDVPSANVRGDKNRYIFQLEVWRKLRRHQLMVSGVLGAASLVRNARRHFRYKLPGRRRMRDLQPLVDRRSSSLVRVADGAAEKSDWSLRRVQG